MIKVTSRAALRSIANEAGRQGEFYSRRNIPELATLWSEIECEVYSALQSDRNLLIGIQENMSSPIPIKPGE
jgi:hypothetical protein